MAQTPLRDVPALIVGREPFEGNSISAQRATAGSAGWLGRLPDVERAKFADAVKQHARALYVVWSYGTPIAWGPLDGALYVPDVRYSVTTSKHQGIVRRARA